MAIVSRRGAFGAHYLWVHSARTRLTLYISGGKIGTYTSCRSATQAQRNKITLGSFGAQRLCAHLALLVLRNPMTSICFPWFQSKTLFYLIVETHRTEKTGNEKPSNFKKPAN